MNRYFLHPVRRNQALLTAHNGLHALLFVMPVLVLYYRDVIGLGFREFLIGEVLFSSIIVAMEVPSGWLSDIGKRKLVLMAGSVCEIVGFALLLNASSFAETLVAQGSLGIGVSLVSGTNTALLYDTLLQYRQQKHFRRMEGLRHGMGLYVIGLASLAGGFLYTIDPRLPLLLTIGAYGVAAIAACLTVEPARLKQPVRRNPLVDMAATIRFALRGHPEIALLILFCGVLFGTTQAGVWIQQPYYIARDVPEHAFGMLACVGFLMAGIASHFGHALEKRIPRMAAFCLILYGVAFSYLLSGLAPGFWGVGLLFLSSIAYGFGMPLIQDVINARVESSRRASIVSTANLAGRLFFIPLGAVVGQAVDHYGIDTAIVLMGAYLALAGSLVLMQLRRSVTGSAHATG